MSPTAPFQTACPTCGRAMTWSPDARWRPFCSERCRLVDLGQWLDEEHRIREGEDETGTPFGPDDEL
jgi:endogenous inhibitor of DNA gyrase (YacG/DUF329 family)